VDQSGGDTSLTPAADGNSHPGRHVALSVARASSLAQAGDTTQLAGATAPDAGSSVRHWNQPNTQLCRALHLIPQKTILFQSCVLG
jgi:hypothetical protein